MTPSGLRSACGGATPTVVIGPIGKMTRMGGFLGTATGSGGSSGRVPIALSSSLVLPTSPGAAPQPQTPARVNAENAAREVSWLMDAPLLMLMRRLEQSVCRGFCVLSRASFSPSLEKGDGPPRGATVHATPASGGELQACCGPAFEPLAAAASG